MGTVVDAGQVLEIKVRVDLGRADVGVPEQFLDAAQILTGFKEMRGEGMAEQVRMHVHRQALAAVAGDGPDRSANVRLVREFGLTSRIHFIGSVRHEELPEWYRAADVTVLSSRSEGLPNVLRESLACGTPFASTDVGSIREIADPMWSRLAPPGDVRELARAIHDVLTPSHRAAAARYRARTWNACASDVTRLFNQLRSAASVPLRVTYKSTANTANEPSGHQQQLVTTGAGEKGELHGD